MIQENVTVYICDACGKREACADNDQSPVGLGGHVYEIGAGGMSAEWWACRRTHAAKAITNALDRENS